MPAAKDLRLASGAISTVASILTFIPDFDAKLAFWGLGAGSRIFGGAKMSDALKIVAGILQTQAGLEQDQGSIAARTAGYERRADEWILQYNLAAHELMQNGRQILTSLIAEQVAHHDYLIVQQQIANAQEIDQFLHDKFTNEELYLWMQGEISRLYYEYYRFAFDTARKAERTMKQELMRPELDGQDFVKFNYWDGGRKGLLSGEALHLDVRRMEMAYLDNNRRELELTRHISLRQFDPVALIMLKTTASCTVSVPEWLFDRDCPGHYMRRIKNVAISIPSVVGPYTSLNCMLTLLGSSVRKSSLLTDGEYARQGAGDDRFVDYSAAAQSIVTSAGSNDTGLFETNLRDERFLPFEGAGAISTWKIELPNDFPAFDFNTISDVILHMRYTARQGVDRAKTVQTVNDLFGAPTAAPLAMLFSLPHDFPVEWSAFVNGAADFRADIRRDYFPYFTLGKNLTVTSLEMYGPKGATLRHHAVAGADLNAFSNAMNNADPAQQTYTVDAAPDAAGPMQVLTRTAGAEVYLVVRYTMG
jgi:Tc toxin complex TcA C-terminal TcB-binding domain